MSGRATILLMSGTTLAGLALACTAASAQQPRGLRTGTPTYIAQPPAQPQRPTVLAEPLPEAMRDPSAPIQGQEFHRLEPPAAARQRPGAGPGRARRNPAPVPCPAAAGRDAAAAPPTPPPPPRKQVPEEDPWAAPGLRLGSVVLKPGITNSIGYDTNPQRVAGADAKGSAFSRHEADLDILSDWGVHELKGKLRGSYLNYFSNHDASRPDGEGNLDLRLDASRDTRILLETRARLDTQRPGSPDLTANVIGRPLTWQSWRLGRRDPRPQPAAADSAWLGRSLRLRGREAVEWRHPRRRTAT